jgi:hypothetical protein
MILYVCDTNEIMVIEDGKLGKKVIVMKLEPYDFQGLHIFSGILK